MKKSFLFLTLISFNLFGNEVIKKGVEIDLSQYQNNEIEQRIQNNIKILQENQNQEFTEIIISKDNEIDYSDKSNTKVENIPQNQVISIENIKNIN